MDKLKPCPFCGGLAVLRKNEERIKPFYVKCGNIGCELIVMTDFYATEEEAFKTWNRRVNDGRSDKQAGGS